MLQQYVHRVMKVSTYDPEARRALLEVFTMLAAPSRLLRPDVVTKVIRDAVRPPQPSGAADLAPDQGIS
jgi:hypothetical protein